MRNFASVNEVKEQLDLAGRDTFLGFTIRMGTHKEHFYRSYIKIQDVFSEVDGLITLAIILIALFAYPYVKLKFYQDLVNELFDLRIYRNSGVDREGLTFKEEGSKSRRKSKSGGRPSLLNLNRGLKNKSEKKEEMKKV